MNEYLESVILYTSLSLIQKWGIFTITFFIAQKIKKWKILDITWGLAFVLAAAMGWILFARLDSSIAVAPIIFITVWGIRLMIHLGKRIATPGDDPRYNDLKGSGKHAEIKAYFIVFLSQGIMTWVMSSPLYFYLTLPNEIKTHPINLMFLVSGSVFATIALLIEWTADYQLHTMKEPGKLLSSGLWKYSRHPNYLGEISFWWSIWWMTRIIYVPNGSLSDYKIFLTSIIALSSPLLISFLIGKVTGPMLEKVMEKYPEWEEHKKTTPYIFPNFMNKKK